MLKLIIRQTNWSIFGSILSYLIGFIVTTYVIRELGEIEIWGRYKTAHVFVSISDTLLSISIPFIILRFFPSLFDSNPRHAIYIVRKMIRYVVFVSVIFMITIFFTADLLDTYVYSNYDNFSPLLLIIAIHAPISIFMGIITALYRSILKIKEIMIYGTFIYVPLRALLTFIIFHYTANLSGNTKIFYFVLIEISTQLLILFLLYYFFNKNEYNILGKMINSENTGVGSNVYEYGKSMYMNSLVTLCFAQALPFFIGILLYADQMGLYAILLTVTGLSMFLNKNLRTVFSPAISKLYKESRTEEMGALYKKITFLVNVLTMPFAILILFFSDEIFELYKFSDDQILYCKPLLCVMMISKLLSLLAGNSGAIMIMAGIEKKELIIRLIRGVFSIICASLFIESYQLQAVVVILIISNVFGVISQLFFINKYVKISPLSRNLIFLILLSAPIIYFAIRQNFEMEIHHYIFVPITIYSIYFLVFYRSIRRLYYEII